MGFKVPKALSHRLLLKFYRTTTLVWLVTLLVFPIKWILNPHGSFRIWGSLLLVSSVFKIVFAVLLQKAERPYRVDHWPKWLWFLGSRAVVSILLADAILWWRSEYFQWELACLVSIYTLVALTLWESISELLPSESGAQRAFSMVSWGLVFLIAVLCALFLRDTVSERNVAAVNPAVLDSHK
jgi:hypothetical protein